MAHALEKVNGGITILGENSPASKVKLRAFSLGEYLFRHWSLHVLSVNSLFSIQTLKSPTST